ncbi:nucleotidyltransferase family protein [Defluviimonas sp. WL0002]|uniref:Nucleotidyltransferase family protein n=1 Tax=Albidovulum marisflavi TaxID=2984159 RepID=A0ABT2Z836_9RHOB|nr:nucleotidyltransferase family protein [Defluviimonas sp. WL0002]MCV2867261.1 nucleotidyltransferase family protein [Defluviimonas sp. WL0002]
MPDALMLFAAGLGTRMRELTSNRPKPLITVAGRALLDHALDLARAAGVGRIVANVHYLAPQIRTHLAGQPVLISDETDALLETGGGLARALPLLDADPVFTLNTDAVWTGANPLSELRAAWRDGAEGLLLLVRREAATGHTGKGDFDMDDAGRLTRGTTYVYTGAQILSTPRFAARKAGAFSINPVWDEMIASGTLFGTLHRGGWCDVGRPESIALAESMLQSDRDV